MAEITTRDVISTLLKSDLSDFDNLIALLSAAIEIFPEDNALSKQLTRKVRFTAAKLIERDVRFYDLYNKALLVLAQTHKDFDAYLLYVEKERDPEDCYYLPRRAKLYWLVKKMQRLIDDELDILTISMPPGTGKALSLYADILTPDGFIKMGDVKIGQMLIGGDGKPYPVVGVFPQGEMTLYRIRTRTTIHECTLDHLCVYSLEDGILEVSELRDILQMIESNRGTDFKIYLHILGKGREAIEEITASTTEPCQCIYIDSPDHTFVTNDYVITHNTTLGEFFISFVMGHYPNTPNLMSSHSGYMTRMFYDAVLDIITSNEYCWSSVFPDVKFESQNAKEETINLDRWQPFKTLTCRSIRGSLTGVTRCEGFLYVDDLVSGIEEALSKDRLDKLYGEYTTDLKSRKKKTAKELHIATRWSVHDVIGRLERQYSTGEIRAEFIAVPDIDPVTGESNFDYDYDVGFDVKYFNDMEMTMDDVSYRCLYKNDPIEREGILYHPDDLLRYLGGLPEGEPDAVLAVCDTKDVGLDSNALVVMYQYGDRFYLEDCVFSNVDPGILDELNANMLVKHGVHQCQFESNKEGSRTANEVEKLVREKGGKCHITKKYTTQNKETKIITRSSWVKEHVYFKDPSEYDSKSDYGKMMAELCSFSQMGKNKHDDAPDALAMFADFVDSLLGDAAEVVRRSDLGF